MTRIATRVLVDTSVWIDYLRDTGRRDDGDPDGAHSGSAPHVLRLHELLSPPSPVVLTPVIFQELLQGAADETAFGRYSDYFGSQPFVFPVHPIGTHVEAARLYQRCRRSGITIRSSIDCLIARTAIEHGLILLHNDEDFRHIARVDSRLSEISS